MAPSLFRHASAMFLDWNDLATLQGELDEVPRLGVRKSEWSGGACLCPASMLCLVGRGAYISYDSFAGPVGQRGAGEFGHAVDASLPEEILK